jgi:ATP-dependent RNA helicase RhlE
MAIHGNKSQSARTKALAEFKTGDLQVLVATDIAARGIDIDQLPHVVNFDLPNVPEDYVHRIGRTGRAGATGEAVSLVCVDEKQLLRDIERLIKREIPQEVIAGFEPDPHAKPEPIQQRRGQQQPRSGGGGGGGNRQPRAGGSGQPAAKREGNAQPKASQQKAAKPRTQGSGGAGAGGNGGGRPAGGGNSARPANGNAAHANRNRSSRSGQRGH